MLGAAVDVNLSARRSQLTRAVFSSSSAVAYVNAAPVQRAGWISPRLAWASRGAKGQLMAFSVGMSFRRRSPAFCSPSFAFLHPLLSLRLFRRVPLRVPRNSHPPPSPVFVFQARGPGLLDFLLLKQMQGVLPNFDPVNLSVCPIPSAYSSASPLPPEQLQQQLQQLQRQEMQRYQQQMAVAATQGEGAARGSSTGTPRSGKKASTASGSTSSLSSAAASGDLEDSGERKAARKAARKEALAQLQRQQDEQRRRRRQELLEKRERREKEKEKERQQRQQSKKNKSRQSAAAADGNEEAAPKKKRRVKGAAATSTSGRNKQPKDESIKPVVVASLGRPHRVVVVGAGFAGLGAALEMQKHGIEVIVVEVS